MSPNRPKIAKMLNGPAKLYDAKSWLRFFEFEIIGALESNYHQHYQYLTAKLASFFQKQKSSAHPPKPRTTRFRYT